MNPNPNPKRAVIAALLCLQLGQAIGSGAAADSASRQVSISKIQVVGNTLLAQPAIDRVAAGFVGQRTVADLHAAAAAVQDLYREAGYGGVVAFIPEQPLGDGTLVIQVLEGKIAQVVVSGIRSFSAASVRRSLPMIQEGVTPRVRAFDTAVQLANENPARQLAVTLEEGQKRGEVDVRITAIEGPVQAFTLSVDDTGNAQTTRTRLSAAYHHADVSGRDDQLAVQVQVSPERLAAVRVFSLSYRLPLYGAGLMAHAYTSYSNVVSAATATAVGELNFSGNGRVTGFELTRFIERAGDFEQRLTAGLDQRDYLNSCAIQGLPEGACGSAGASVSTHPLTVGYQALRKGGRPAGVGVTLASNLALGGANGGAADFEAVRPGATRHFQALRLQAFLSLPLADNWQMNFRGAAQAASAPLVPGEQFGLTGVNIVRGYEEREVTGDSGFAASFEALLPPMLSLAPGDIPTGLHGLRLLAFVDAGVTRNRNDQTCDGADRRCRLSSLGIGARFSVGTSSWRIDLARANDTARLTNRGDVRLHFSARMAFP